MGCCTVCAVKVKEGELYQPEGLGEHWVFISTLLDHVIIACFVPSDQAESGRSRQSICIVVLHGFLSNAGLSLDLREQGYGLMCVGYPLTDCVLETVPEDEIYDLQFGAAIKVSWFGK